MREEGGECICGILWYMASYLSDHDTLWFSYAEPTGRNDLLIHGSLGEAGGEVGATRL